MTKPARIGLAGVLAVGSLVAVAGVVAPAANAANCGAWTRSTVASGLGVAENLGFDGRGALIVSSQSVSGPGGSVVALTHNGAKRVLLPNVTGPSGIAVSDRGVFVATESTSESGLLSRPTGKISRLDTTTSRTRVVVRGLIQPNGLVMLSDGRFVASRDIGPSTSLSVADPATGKVAPFGPRSLTSTNGLALNRDKSRLYVSSTFNATTTITALDPKHPRTALRVYTIPGFGPLNSADDLTVGPDGKIYATLNGAGRVVRIDPRTGSVCTVADGLPFSSSVRFGSGPGWDPKSAYVTSFLGTVTRLRPASS